MDASKALIAIRDRFRASDRLDTPGIAADVWEIARPFVPVAPMPDLKGMTADHIDVVHIAGIALQAYITNGWETLDLVIEILTIRGLPVDENEYDPASCDPID